MRILVVEDERRVSGFLAKGLREEGHAVEVVEDLTSARQAVAGSEFDVLLVDRMLPDGDGLALIRELRRAGNATAAICLTARDRVDERVEGLHGGADDYLLKPFSFEELLARIAAVSRRQRTLDERLTLVDLIVDLGAHRVSRAGVEIRLTPHEFTLLTYLMQNVGRVQSRTRLLERVWDVRHDPGTNVVDVAVSALRQKIDKGFDPPLLHTVRGVGYVLEARGR